MPTIITYNSGAINYVQPEVMGTPEGTDSALFVDANLSQYTTGSSGISCTDVDGLTLWTVGESDIEAMFIAKGAANPTIVGTSGVLLAPEGDKLIFWMQATSESRYFMYLGVAPISATGAVGEPTLTNYLRLRNGFAALYIAVACWERGGPGGDLIIMTRDTTTDKTQFWICPTILDLEGGTFKGAHLGCDAVLDSDQGPSWAYRWTHNDAYRMAYANSVVQEGSVSVSPVGFQAAGKMWFVIPRAWMENGGSGIAAAYADDYPNGWAFSLDVPFGSYAAHVWPTGQVNHAPEITGGADDASSYFAPAPPWTEEYTRLQDGGANGGWLASYNGRPALIYVDGTPYLFFAIIDGNAAYEDSIGSGERVYYAKVRGYKWTGATWSQFDTAEGIVLRDGDLSFTGYYFPKPDSQNIFVYDTEIYFQINQATGMGGNANERCVLTQFGEYVEIESRPSEVSGRVRIVPGQRVV
jgi:hypothetical protein